MPALTLASVLLFYTHTVWFVTIGVALAAHVLLLLRPPARVFRRLFGSAVVTLALVLPFAIWAHVWDRAENPGAPRPPRSRYVSLAMFRHYLLELNIYGAPVPLLLLGGAAAAAGRRRFALAVVSLLGAGVVPIVLGVRNNAVELWAFGAVLGPALFVGTVAILRDAARPWETRGWMPGALLVILFFAWLAIPSQVLLLSMLRYTAPLFPLVAFLAAASVFAIFRRGRLAWSA